MATSTNGNATCKVIRIHDDEKELLSRLRQIYANDYRKFSEYIRQEPDVPVSIKKIYKVLDERKAYRRISDYFHRERRSGRGRRSPSSNIYAKIYRRSTTRSITQIPESISVIQMKHEIDEDDDDHHQQQSHSPTMTNSDESIENTHLIDDNDPQQIRTSSSSSTNLTHQQSSELLSVRANIQKALSELDRVIISKSDSLINNNHHQQLPMRKINGHSKLDDIVRSLSNVVTQQQDNVRTIINQSSTLLGNDHMHSENVSIKHVLERLNTLVDRGHLIYDRIESIISDI